MKINFLFAFAMLITAGSLNSSAPRGVVIHEVGSPLGAPAIRAQQGLFGSDSIRAMMPISNSREQSEYVEIMPAIELMALLGDLAVAVCRYQKIEECIQTARERYNVAEEKDKASKALRQGAEAVHRAAVAEFQVAEHLGRANTSIWDRGDRLALAISLEAQATEQSAQAIFRRAGIEYRSAVTSQLPAAKSTLRTISARIIEAASRQMPGANLQDFSANFEISGLGILRLISSWKDVLRFNEMSRPNAELFYAFISAIFYKVQPSEAEAAA
ncbi:MAG: hypothetical protein LBR89_00720 [Holosporales bacterium]|jgi:hypothetical protein|nr:hypothetical protein [Holosporales bacterium]